MKVCNNLFRFLFKDIILRKWHDFILSYPIDAEY